MCTHSTTKDNATVICEKLMELTKRKLIAHLLRPLSASSSVVPCALQLCRPKNSVSLPTPGEAITSSASWRGGGRALAMAKRGAQVAIRRSHAIPVQLHLANTGWDFIGDDDGPWACSASSRASKKKWRLIQRHTSCSTTCTPDFEL